MNDRQTESADYLRPAAGNVEDRLCTAEQIRRFGVNLLTAVGTAKEEAETVIDELVAADLAGHSSHGVMRLNQYLTYIEDGSLRLGVTLSQLSESPVLDVFDGQFGFGQSLMRQLVTIAIHKGREHGTYTGFGRNFNHVGRLGSYVEEAAKQGFMAMMMVNVNGSSRVTPFGGTQPRLGTNPICIGLPYRDRTIMVDTTTCVTAEGKLRIAMQNGRTVPDGHFVNKDGLPTNDPAEFYTSPTGAILPLGGPVGYKGSGLSILVEMICGILSGAGFGRHDVAVGTNAVWLYLVDLERVRDRNEYAHETEQFVEYIKGTRLAPGTDEVLLPGEREHRQTIHGEANGIVVLGGTWQKLASIAEKYNVSMPASLPVNI